MKKRSMHSHKRGQFGPELALPLCNDNGRPYKNDNRRLRCLQEFPAASPPLLDAKYPMCLNLRRHISPGAANGVLRRAAKSLCLTWCSAVSIAMLLIVAHPGMRQVLLLHPLSTPCARLELLWPALCAGAVLIKRWLTTVVSTT